MLPKVIIHNTISVNGALAGFNVDMDLHYEEASRFGADTYLTGTDTVLSAEVDIPPENEEDFKKRINNLKTNRILTLDLSFDTKQGIHTLSTSNQIICKKNKKYIYFKIKIINFNFI